MKKIELPRHRTTIAYRERGSGDPVVLLHAFPLDHEMWRPQLEALSNSYRVIAPDYPSFGESGDAGEALTIPKLADILADFLQEIGISEAVIGGLSMGGYVALSFAHRQPQRLRGLILADTKAEADDDAARANRDKMITLAQTQGSSGVIDALLSKLLSPDTLRSEDETVKTIQRIGSRQGAPAVAAAILALRDRPDATPFLEHIVVPTLVIVGEHDAITPPASAENLVKRIANATLATIPGAGHLSNLEAPEAFNQAVRQFLDQKCSRRTPQ